MPEYPVTRRDIQWLAEVVKSDKNHYKKDEYVYEFSSGRKFKITDHQDTGIYDGT